MRGRQQPATVRIIQLTKKTQARHPTLTTNPVACPISATETQSSLPKTNNIAAKLHQGLSILQMSPIQTLRQLQTAMHLHLVLNHCQYQRLSRIKQHPSYGDRMKHITSTYIPFNCRSFAIGKQSRSPHKPNQYRIYSGEECISIDKVGPLLATISNKPTLLTVSDAESRYLTAVPAPNRATAAQYLLTILTHIMFTYGKHSRLLVSDNAPELLSNNIKNNIKGSAAHLGVHVIPITLH